MIPESHKKCMDLKPSLCKFRDEIAVFHEGVLIQQGTHEELVADETGKYYELWYAQAQYYTDENT